MEVGLHQTSPEGRKEAGLQRPQTKSRRVIGTHCRRSVPQATPFEKLIGDLEGAYSRRINIQHRLVYQVLEDEKVVKVLRLWSHYE